MAVTWPAKNNYATGDVLTAANMNAIGDDLNDLYAGNQGGATKAAGKNAVINGAMEVWQRGTSISLAASTPAYTTDRWYLNIGANQASTVSRQATGDTTNLPNIQYCARVQRNSGQTGTANSFFTNSFETINSIPFAGKTVTLSFYARAGANYSPASSAFLAYIINGTGTDQNRGVVGYTGENVVATTTVTLTTTWQRFTVTGTVPTNATEIATLFAWNPTGTAGTNDYFEITGVQLEQNATATPFARNASTYQGELAACQRYYWRSTPGTTYGFYGFGYASSTTNYRANIYLPTTLRTNPSSIDFANLSVDAISAISTITIDWSSQNAVTTNCATTGIVANSPYRLLNNNNTTGYLGFNAEL